MNTVLYINDYEFKCTTNNFDDTVLISYIQDDIVRLEVILNNDYNKITLFNFTNKSSIKYLGKKILTILLNHLHSVNKIDDKTVLCLHTTSTPHKKLISYYRSLGLKCYRMFNNKIINHHYCETVFMKCTIRHFLNLNFEDTFLS